MAEIARIEDKQAKKKEAGMEWLCKTMELYHLTQAANQDPAQGGKLRAFICENPDIIEGLRELAFHTKAALLRAAVPQEGLRIMTEQEMTEMQKQLSEGTTSPVELLLIDAVLLCWLRVQYAENYRTSMMKGERTIREVEFAEKMLTRSHNRYSKALISLARVQAITREKGADHPLRLLNSAG